jgi:hypothetical protein
MFVDKTVKIVFVYPVIPSELDSTEFSALNILIHRERSEFEVPGCFLYRDEVALAVHKKNVTTGTSGQQVVYLPFLCGKSYNMSCIYTMDITACQ